MLGLILSGGKSARMGRDKGLLKNNKINWVQTIKLKLELLNLPIKISINATQIENYATIFDTNLLIVDNKDLKVKGPLLGLLSAHLQNPKESIFIIACDLQLMHTDLIKELLHNHHNYNNYDAYVFINENELEPLCGIYTSNALSKIVSLLLNNQIRKFSMKYILELLKTKQISVQPHQVQYFTNFNTLEKLKEL